MQDGSSEAMNARLTGQRFTKVKGLIAEGASHPAPALQQPNPRDPTGSSLHRAMHTRRLTQSPPGFYGGMPMLHCTTARHEDNELPSAMGVRTNSWADSSANTPAASRFSRREPMKPLALEANLSQAEWKKDLSAGSLRRNFHSRKSACR